MTEVQQKKVLWPELSRFGAKLTVATNPSVGASFLKFTIFDRELYQRTCGYAHGDIYDIARSSGFYYATSEVHSRSSKAYDVALSTGASVGAADQAVTESLESLFFYNPHVQLRTEWIRKLVPAVRESDYKQVSISEIKHLDHAYLAEEQLRQLVSQQQAFTDSEAGVFYTIPTDRAILAEAQDAPISINELLAFKDLPPGEVDARSKFSAAQRALAAFNAVPLIERLMVGQTLGPNGLPLKALSLKGAAVAYASRAAAVQANAGREEGVERVDLPYGLPIAFDYPTRRLLLVTDSRFLEVPNLMKLPEPEADPQNVQSHWDAIAKAQELLAQFEQLRVGGLLDVATWSKPEVLAEIEAKFMEIADAMSGIMRPQSDASFLEHTDLIRRSGLNAHNFPKVFAPDFLHFLGQFKRTLYPQMAEMRAKRLAESLVPPRAKANPPSAKDSVSGRREDAGEKIGGARKDYAKRALSVAEVSSLTLREMGEVVTKDNVWPPLDYSAMRDSGVAPEVAYIIRELRKALPVNPLKGGRNMHRILVASRTADSLTEKACVNFIAAVSVVRDAVADVKTQQDLLYAMKRIYEEAGARANVHGQVGIRTGTDAISEAFQDGAGTKFLLQAMPQITVVDGLPSSYALQRSLLGAQAKTRGEWSWAIRERAPRTTQDPKDRREPPVMHLEHIERVGVDVRHGADIDEETFLNTYGFRAVEYGKWLPQAERQQVLNHAFDAFADLGKVLGLPPRALGLGGRMAIAFGARGTGGRNAGVAHFESVRFVMNMTRLRGAGKLAHEYGHALDCALAEATGISKMQYASEVLPRKAAMPAIVQGLRDLISTSKIRYLSKQEALERELKSSTQNGFAVDAYWQRVVVGWVEQVDRFLPASAQRGQFYDSSLEIFRQRQVPVQGLERLNLKTLPDMSAFSRDILALFEKHAEGAKLPNGLVDYPARTMAWYEQRINRLLKIEQEYSPTTYKGDTKFLADAKWFDELRTTPYWSTDVELFARAFEAWVQQRVEHSGSEKSQYLVHGCAEGGGLDGHFAYPRGEEFIRLDAAFSAFFAQYRSELTQLMDLGGAAPAKRSDMLNASFD
jgi:hypothetical protein